MGGRTMAIEVRSRASPGLALLTVPCSGTLAHPPRSHPMTRTQLLASVSLAAALGFAACQSESPAKKNVTPHPVAEAPPAAAAAPKASTAAADSDAHRLDWWREARFGMFIHWGLYSIPAGQWGKATGHAEWIRDTAKIPVEEYEKFRDQFNPVKFDADAWVAAA